MNPEQALDWQIGRYRQMSGDTIEWIWIGTHNEFDNLFL